MRTALKSLLAPLGAVPPPRGATLLTYHRVGGGSTDELDVTREDFARQVDLLSGADVVDLDSALGRLATGDSRACVVITFDDGFADVHANAWPLLRRAGLPFTLYLSTAFVGGTMSWEGSTATAAGDALTWRQVEEMVASGLCTVGNHTHRHCRPEDLDSGEVDRCGDEVEARLGIRPRHFAFTWGVPVPRMSAELRSRFVSAATGAVGRNLPGADTLLLRRIPVRRTDPLPFVRTAVSGGLAPQHAYEHLVRTAKRMGARA
ncbi:MAG: polysaccharide deacetylase family protein [Actinomycetes bacterium]